MSEKVVSLFQRKKQTGQRFVLTDEWLDTLAESYFTAQQNESTNLTFQQWVEYQTIRFY